MPSKGRMLMRQKGLRELSVVEEAGDGESSAHDGDEHTFGIQSHPAVDRNILRHSSWGDDNESICMSSVFAQEEDEDIQSLPSLSSINAESVATSGYYSVQSSVQSSCMSRSGNDSVVSSDFSLTSSVASASNSTGKRRSKFLIEIETKVAASTVDCLAPVIPSANHQKSMKKQMARWGNAISGEASPVSVVKKSISSEEDYGRTKGRFHFLASRNPDAMPEMPPQPTYSICMPSGTVRAQSAVLSPLSRKGHGLPRRNMSMDQVPFVPRRQTSLRNLNG